MRGAERSLVVVFFSFTPRRIAFSISSPWGGSPGLWSPDWGTGWQGGVAVLGLSLSLSSPSLSADACLCSAMGLGFWFPGGGLTDAWPLHEVDAPWLPPPASGLWSGLSSAPTGRLGSPPGMSGTVGVLTGITGVLMGIGPAPMVPRLTAGLVEGVRLMVATPGVTITGPSVVGRPAVEAGRLAWNMRR